MLPSWCSTVRRAFLIALVLVAAATATAAAVANSPVASSRSNHTKRVATKHRRHRQSKRCVPARWRRHAGRRVHDRARCKAKRRRRKPPPKPTKKPTAPPLSKPSSPPSLPPSPPTPPVVGVPVTTLPCSTTLSPGGNVAGAIEAAHDGSAICLSTGTYSEIDVSGANHASYVTVEPAPGATPTVQGVQISNSAFLRFQQLHMTDGFNMIRSGHDFQFLDNNIGPAGYGVVMNGSPNPITNVVIQGNAIHDLDFTGSSAGYAGGQGVTLYNGDDVVVSHNTFWANSWHWIQCGGCDNLAVDHNTFKCPCNEHHNPQAHLNVLQIWQGGSNDSFTNNVINGTGGPTEICGGCVLLENGPGGQTCSDRFANPNVSNNLFIDPGGSLPIQVGLNDGGTFESNTIVGGQYGSAFGLGAAPACSGRSSTNMTVTHNIQVEDTKSGSNLMMGNCTGACAFDYNVTGDGSAQLNGAAHYVINWRPNWAAGKSYQAAGLPFAAGYQGSIGP